MAAAESNSLNIYEVAGLRLRSEISLPELAVAEPAAREPDVCVELGPVPEKLSGASSTSSVTEISQDDVLIKVPGVARYRAQSGQRIRIEPMPGARASDLRLFLLGSALGAIYFQRGDFPLHASVVVVRGAAVAFTGGSGAGKSTMAAWLHAQGFPLLCDDVCVVRFDSDGKPVAYPGFPRLKLWKDTLTAFEIDAGKLLRDYSRADKYHLPIAARFRDKPVPLKHILALQFSEAETAPRVTDVRPSEAVMLLRDNTYRFQYISGMGLTRKHFLDCTRLARTTRIQRLVRPREHAVLADCQRLIEGLAE
jgi:hypothetical protein